jgi:hypothetical protein
MIKGGKQAWNVGYCLRMNAYLIHSEHDGLVEAIRSRHWASTSECCGHNNRSSGKERRSTHLDSTYRRRATKGTCLLAGGVSSKREKRAAKIENLSGRLSINIDEGWGLCPQHSLEIAKSS